MYYETQIVFLQQAWSMTAVVAEPSDQNSGRVELGALASFISFIPANLDHISLINRRIARSQIYIFVYSFISMHKKNIAF
jgi:hypothetical protein